MPYRVARASELAPSQVRRPRFSFSVQMKYLHHPRFPRRKISKIKRQRLYERDDYRCRYCGLQGSKTGFPRVARLRTWSGTRSQRWSFYWTQLEIDHIIPVSKGGTNDEANLTTSCWRCNLKKWNHNVLA